MLHPNRALGDKLTIFNAKEKDIINFWQKSGTIKKAFDSSVKGYIIVLDSLAKLQLPKNPAKNSLKYEYGFIILQCKVLDKRSFWLDIKYTDRTGQKKKLSFHGGTPYSYSKNNISDQCHAFNNIKIPVGKIVEKLWVNL